MSEQRYEDASTTCYATIEHDGEMYDCGSIRGHSGSHNVTIWWDDEPAARPSSGLPTTEEH